MAVLTAKPLNLAQKIRRRIFKGSPNIFADVDINNYSEISDYDSQKIHEKVGAFLEHSNISVLFSQGPGMLYASVTIPAGAVVFFKGVQFTLPTLLPYVAYPHSYAGIVSSDIFSLYLIAEKYTTDFAADNAIAGITGTGLTTPLPSSDAVRYRNERIAGTWGTNVIPTLTTGEEVICILGQGVWVDDDAQVVPIWVPTALEIGDLSNWEFPQQTFTPEDNPANSLTKTYASTETGLIGNLSIAFFTLKRVLLSYHTWMRTDIFPYLQTLALKWTKLQELSQGSNISITSSASTVLLIPTDGNFFKISWTGVTNHRLTDIKKVGNVTIANGAIIYLFCSQTTPANNGFLVNTVGTSFKSSDYEMEDPFNGISTTDLVLTVNSTTPYSATSYGSVNIIKAVKVDGYWILMRANRDHEILNYASNIYSELTTSIATVKAATTWRVVGSTSYPWPTNMSNGISGMHYRKDGLGDVIIEGDFFIASPGTTGSTVYQLPSSYRPEIDLYIPIVNLSSSPTPDSASIMKIAASTGIMSVISNSCSNHAYSFSPIRFRGV